MFSPQDNLLCSVAELELKLWEVDTHLLHHPALTSLQVSRVSKAGRISGAKVSSRLKGHTDVITVAVFSPDGGLPYVAWLNRCTGLQLASGSVDKSVRLWTNLHNEATLLATLTVRAVRCWLTKICRGIQSLCSRWRTVQTGIRYSALCSVVLIGYSLLQDRETGL
jgi:WD40 repeat protein